ncbi:MAG: TIGR02221 family CRISPR-associated protein [Saprospiraceae bacterium]
MARKVFISFLGTNDYLLCNYFEEGEEERKIKNVKYIQEAIVRLYCQDFGSTDKLCVFVTEDAKNKNWKDNGHLDRKTKKNIPNEGLNTRLNNLKLDAKIEVVDINDGFNTTQIWSIFDKMYNQINEEDELIFDITHAFRFLPMLGMVFMDYVRTLKKVTVRSIHYGAFEALGSFFDVKEMDIEDRNAEILDLTNFAVLQQWTVAASDFINYGRSAGLSSLTKQKIIPLLKTRNENTKVAREFNLLSKSLDVATDCLQTNRGKELIKGRIFSNLQNNLQNISNEDFIVPMKPILRRIERKIKPFSKIEDWKNGFIAVEWCIEHHLTQQGITMLQESLFTYYCILHDLDYQNEKDRDLISACFFIKNNDFENDANQWNAIAKSNAKKVIEIVNTIPKELATDYESLTQGARNDINHGGFSKNESPTNLRNKLKKSYQTIRNLIQS